MEVDLDQNDALGTVRQLTIQEQKLNYYSLNRLEQQGFGIPAHMPYSHRILLESLVRQLDQKTITQDHVRTLARWGDSSSTGKAIPFKPARIIMQDLTGVPALVDLAAMRDAAAETGEDCDAVVPRVPIDLVVDHSLQVDHFGTIRALAFNEQMEFARNHERYAFLRWGAKAFSDFRVIPPATGIVHQINL